MTHEAVETIARPIARSRRDSRPPQIKSSTVLGIIGIVFTAGAVVWGMSAIVNGKADISTVHQIQTDVEVIKVRQEAFIRAMKPDLIKE